MKGCRVLFLFSFTGRSFGTVLVHFLFQVSCCWFWSCRFDWKNRHPSTQNLFLWIWNEKNNIIVYEADKFVLCCDFLKVLAPLPIGFAVFIVHLATIPITGTGINPARSLGAAVIYNKEKAWDDQVCIYI